MAHASSERNAFAIFVLIGAAGAAALALVGPDVRLWVVLYVVVLQVGLRGFLTLSGGWGIARLRMAMRVHAAMRRGEIVLHYQPKVALATGDVVGVEALVRWEHPTRGILPPGDWIAGTELPWLEWRFLRHTLDVACRQAVRWERDGMDLVIWVNVTPRCFADRRLPDELASALRASGASASRLAVELTEAVLELSPTAIEMADRLNGMGIALALDDFGVGHSSMDRVARLPIHELKIDRRFVGNQLRSPRDGAVVLAAISLAHALGLAVVGEGVESAQEVETLAAQGCDAAQGYFICRPLPPERVAAWHATRSPVPC